MAEDVGAHAWLYQYNPVEDAEWLSDLANGRRVDWRIIRWSKSTHAGDLVVFWESGKKGGITGWGRITEEPYFEEAETKRGRWRVPLHSEIWLPRPVPREQIKEVLSPDNSFLRSAQGANFPLQPDEVKRILGVLGVPGPDLEEIIVRIRPHRETSKLEPEPKPAPAPPVERPREGWPPDLTPDRITPAARQILQWADFRGRGLTGALSSTRLFLATFDPEKWAVQPEDSSPAENAALRTLRELVVMQRNSLLGARDTYLSELRHGATKYSITKNALAVLAHAKKSEFTQRSGGRLSADGIIAALLTTKSERMLGHLQKAGISLELLREQFLERMTPYGGSLRSLWQRALMNSDLGPSKDPEGVGIARIGNDNAWNQDVTDSLGAKREAEAFASLAISAHFIPPLAVGVFGDWGSGKSFFMRLVYEHIEELRKSDREAGDGAELLADVVQIRFNAWHYVDTNLWASLVDHIFSELDRATSTLPPEEADKLFEQLTTARELTLASAERLIQRRKEHSDAAVFAADAQARLQEKRQEGPSLNRWAIAQEMFEKELGDEGNQELKRQAKELGVEELVHTGKDLRDAVLSLDNEQKQAGLVVKHALGDLSSGRGFGIFLLMLAATSVVVYGLRELAVWVFHDANLRETVGHTVLGACALLLAAIDVVRKSVGHIRTGVAFLRKTRDRYDQIAEEALKEPVELVKQRQEELARLSAEVTEGEARLKASAQRVGEAAREYNAKTGRGRLLSFVRSRATGEEYAKHLGLVSTVRKDFEELSELVAESHTPDSKRLNDRERERTAHRLRVEALIQKAVDDAPGGIPLLHADEQKQLQDSIQGEDSTDGGPTVSRIVLYIDDLDRCQPEKVVEVLQAVHLLLSFRLFVVFVAVDVRWVTRALHKCYPQLLGDTAERGIASAHDYLEKIFQVPYWVRPMNETSSAKFISDRLQLQKPALPDAPSSPRQRPLQPANDLSDSSPTALPETADAKHVQDLEETTAEPAFEPLDEDLPASDFDQVDAAREAPSKAAEEGSSFRSSLLHVELSEAEGAFMTELACWAGNSPRRLIRFMNVYQVMKASLSEDGAFSANDGEFVVLMAQAAIVTGAPSLVEGWHTHLLAADDGTSAPVIAEQVLDVGKRGEQAHNLRSILGAVNTRRPWTDAADLRRYCALSRRFSFGTDYAEQANRSQELSEPVESARSSPRPDAKA